MKKVISLITISLIFLNTSHANAQNNQEDTDLFIAAGPVIPAETENVNYQTFDLSEEQQVPEVSFVTSVRGDVYANNSMQPGTAFMLVMLSLVLMVSGVGILKMKTSDELLGNTRIKKRLPAIYQI